MRCSQRTLGIRARKDHRGVDLISDALPFGRLCGQQCNRLREVFQPIHDAVIRICDEAGNVIETHEHAGEFKEW